MPRARAMLTLKRYFLRGDRSYKIEFVRAVVNIIADDR
jgi:hypothetical protein